jgi:hypothetical protein
MRTNESIIAVPVGVEKPGQTRQFLVRLVEQLDLVIGTRGGDPYVPESRLNETTAELTKLELAILQIVEGLLTVDGELALEILEQVNLAIEALKSDSSIANASVAVQSVSAPPTKSEVEAIDAKVVGNAQSYNSLLTALRETGIISV